MRRPLSAIIKDMSLTVLCEPDLVPSPEAAHAALLFSHIAWNQATGLRAPMPDYRQLIREFESSNPDLWTELTSSDGAALITTLMAFKQAHYPDDRRQIVVCGMRGDNVRVEWFDPPAS